MELFRCERLKADLTARGCLMNQGLGRAGGNDPLNLYYGCVDCQVGRVIRKTSGLPVPQLRLTYDGWRVAAEVKRGKGERQTIGMAPRSKRKTGQEQNMDKKASRYEGNDIPLAPAGETAGVGETAKAGVGHKKVCSVCGVNPRQGRSSMCKECLRNVLNNAVTKAKRNEKIGAKAKKAYQVLRRYEAGEIIEAGERYKAIFCLWPEMEERLRARVQNSLRTLEAEMAFILREALRVEE